MYCAISASFSLCPKISGVRSAVDPDLPVKSYIGISNLLVSLALVFAGIFCLTLSIVSIMITNELQPKLPLRRVSNPKQSLTHLRLGQRVSFLPSFGRRPCDRPYVDQVTDLK